MKIRLTPHEKYEMIAKLEQAIQLLKEEPAWTPCHLCDYHVGKVCKKYDAEIPEEFLGVGCEQWVEAIPF